MRAIPFSYIARNLWVRRVSTVVVYVFATVLMMSEGIRSTLVATGQPDNVIVLRKGAGAEINSGIERDKAHVLSTLPGIATDAAGRPLISPEPVVLISLPKRSNGKPSNVTVRGSSELGLQLLEQAEAEPLLLERPEPLREPEPEPEEEAAAD